MKWQSIAEKILIGLFILIAIFLVIPLIPIKGNYIIKSVQSGSMSPAIRQGSIVVIVPRQNYQIGDIITFGEKGYTTTHRIYNVQLGTDKKIYLTKGDANESPDMREIYETDILGKVIFSIPLLGYLINFIKSPFGFFTVILVPAGIIIYDEIKKIYATYKKKQI